MAKRPKRKTTNTTVQVAVRIPRGLRDEVYALVGDENKVRVVIADLLRRGIAARASGPIAAATQNDPAALSTT